MKVLKLIILCGAICCGSVISASAFWPFGSLTASYKNMKDSVDKNLSDIKLGLNDNTATIGKVNTNLGLLSNNQLSMTNKLDTMLNAKVNVGYQHDNTDTSVGGNQTNYNDTGLMTTVVKTMNNGYVHVIILLILYIGRSGYVQAKQRTQLENRLADFMDSQEKSEGKYIRFLERLAELTIDEVRNNHDTKKKK